MDTDKIILFDSHDAAIYRDLRGWVSRLGRFFGDDEHLARWDGCTHKKCGCGKVYEKTRTMCPDCSWRRKMAQYEAKERQVWDGEAYLYSLSHDEYFPNEDCLDEYLKEHECSVDDLLLIICEPNLPREVDVDYWSDELPEDCDSAEDALGDGVMRAIDTLNKELQKLGPLSWSPGRYAALLMVRPD